jgi:hypothetical protein
VQRPQRGEDVVQERGEQAAEIAVGEPGGEQAESPRRGEPSSAQFVRAQAGAILAGRLSISTTMESRGGR